MDNIVSDGTDCISSKGHESLPPSTSTGRVNEKDFTESLSKERYYKMDEAFAQRLRKKAKVEASFDGKDRKSHGADDGDACLGLKFSLLESLGRTKDDKKRCDVENVADAKSSLGWSLSVIRTQSDSSDEDEETEATHRQSKEDTRKSQQDKANERSANVDDGRSRPTFFYSRDDPRILAAVKSFRRTHDLALVRKRWECTREKVFKDYKATVKKTKRQAKLQLMRRKQSRQHH